MPILVHPIQGRLTIEKGVAADLVVTAKTVTTRQPRLEVTAENAKSLAPTLAFHPLANQDQRLGCNGFVTVFGAFPCNLAHLNCSLEHQLEQSELVLYFVHYQPIRC